MMLTSLDILGPIAHVLGRIEDEIRRAWHVMFALTFAHVIVRAVGLVGMIADVTILLFARDLVGCVS